MKLALLSAAFACIASALLSAPAQGETSDAEPYRWQSAVFFRTIVERDGKQNTVGGSGFFLRQGEATFLATAAHVMADTTPDTQLVFTQHGKRMVLTLTELGMSPVNKWRTQANYDVALLPIDTVRIDGVAVGKLAGESLRVPAIKRELEVVGFPFGVGVEGEDALHPVVVTSHVASREIDSPFVPKIDRVVLATPSIADGTSGGPVFGRVKGKDADDESGWELVGIFAGNLIDRSGAKLAKIVPIHALKDLLRASDDAGASARLGQ